MLLAKKHHSGPRGNLEDNWKTKMEVDNTKLYYFLHSKAKHHLLLRPTTSRKRLLPTWEIMGNMDWILSFSNRYI